MRVAKLFARGAAALLLFTTAALAADFPAPKSGDWIVHDFHFHTGEVFPELKLHYTTIGDPSGEPVLILHGTAGSGTGMLAPFFGGELFGKGQPLDAAKYFIILPDGIGAGGSSKPSDGLRAKYPRYDYEDMVRAQYLLVTQGLGIHHLRLVLGNSMGGMHVWMWGEEHPDFMDALVPMASQPTAMSGRNWLMRRLLVDSVRDDPAWKGGNYTESPPLVHFVGTMFGVATIGGTLNYQKLAPTAEAADKLVAERLALPFKADANDFMYQWDASRDYDAAPGLEKITARVLAINSADDERNPPETGLETDALKRVRNARLYLIPASSDTRGHGTTGIARFWKDELATFLPSVPHRGS